MVHHKQIFLTAFIFILLAGGVALLGAEVGGGGEYGTAQLGDILPPECRNPQTVATQCKLPQFFILINNIIKVIIRLTLIIVPVLIAFGGIVILTAGGSSERVGQGKAMITAAVVGLVIVLLSFVILKLIFLALGVNSQFVPQGQIFNP